ncbi:MAG TPA: dienelactone hydrolase family protein [Gaiellaceae bacterium]|jgi:carboxymethylenebutenolidase|nr:dienelactone hydrolase family protein [Gaiellaceae bacterium]
MCFDTDSEPPVPRIAGAAVSHDDLTLTAADGNAFAAFLATPDGPASTGVVVLPDIRGLYRFYEELALRFAERGHAAIALDYFGRTAGAEKRDDDFEYRPHVEQTTPEGVMADTRAAAERLRELGVTSVFAVGFCFGGSNAWLASADVQGLKGAVGFYGRPARVLDRVPDMVAPVLALQGGADQNITAEDNAELEQALAAAGVEHEVVTFEGAPHSFFDRKQEEFQDASGDAWRRTLAFIDSHS